MIRPLLLLALLIPLFCAEDFAATEKAYAAVGGDKAPMEAQTKFFVDWFAKADLTLAEVPANASDATRGALSVLNDQLRMAKDEMASKTSSPSARADYLFARGHDLFCSSHTVEEKGVTTRSKIWDLYKQTRRPAK